MPSHFSIPPSFEPPAATTPFSKGSHRGAGRPLTIVNRVEALLAVGTSLSSSTGPYLRPTQRLLNSRTIRSAMVSGAEKRRRKREAAAVGSAVATTSIPHEPIERRQMHCQWNGKTFGKFCSPSLPSSRLISTYLEPEPCVGRYPVQNVRHGGHPRSVTDRFARVPHAGQDSRAGRDHHARAMRRRCAERLGGRESAFGRGVEGGEHAGGVHAREHQGDYPSFIYIGCSRH